MDWTSASRRGNFPAMNRILPALAAALAAVTAAPAVADLPQGASAPRFSTQGALAGKSFAFNLQSALRKGPVVIYFYPKSFTQGCTLEANAFAEAMGQFRAAGATVIGLSVDTLETQKKFSTEHCRDQFPVGVATPALLKAYDVELKKPDGTAMGISSRTSYVIDRSGKVRMAYTNMDYKEHVSRSLATVQGLGKKGR